LNVGSERAGIRARCPKCKERITVPPETPADFTSPPVPSAETESEPDSDPYAQFVVYDEEVEWVYEAEEVPATPARKMRAEPSRVAVPRSVVYAQGILLAVVGLVAFVLGWMMRGSERVPPAAGAAQPCRLSGAVRYLARSGQELPDDGAVVLVLPTDERPAPTNKADIAGLRPGDPLPRGDSDNLRIIYAIGGAYARTDAEGRYQLQVPNFGKYHVLILSKNAVRDEAEQLERIDIAQLGRYVQPPTELLGDSKYSWREITLRGDRALDFTF